MNPHMSSEALPTEFDDEPAGRPIPRDLDALLYPVEAAYLLGLSNRTLEAARLKGGGVPYFRLGRRAIRYRRRDIFDWAEARRRRSTSDPGPGGDAAGGAPVEG